MAHGGASPQAQEAAERRELERSLEKVAAAAIARHRREYAAWQRARVEETASLMHCRPEQVTPGMIGFCRGWYGRPDGEETAPRLRFDRRYGSRLARQALDGPLGPQVMATAIAGLPVSWLGLRIRRPTGGVHQ